ncbi:ferric reductase-like transmembrane domain-containing protein [Actinomycetospora straminea]|uniref:Ferric oxidoreductase domain-containing protein n=1 Tax=Actinomycetospora straminea TaxID=663607 RepID=A0ABP9DWZ6_9PSEU|nr:ferric reductase-like transmembrane domain-containing protein [Actinomycetospora straminea]MDD7932276.1 ferric reductase-like transmembrane domain-containing protein [Actinomycetospora straminea]
MIELWNISRALGLVALLLLGVVLALGALHNTSLTELLGQALPRFVLVALHRNLALITVVFVALHVVTVLVTPYLPLRWYHVVVPGTASFNPWPVGMGALALDLLLAVVISSALRKYLSKRAWLVVHWTSYVCFPVAVAHAVANASLRGGTWWTLVVPLVATALVVAALLHRRTARRRPASVPLADRGRTDPAEARKAADHATGAQLVVRGEGPEVAANAPFAASTRTNAPFAAPAESDAGEDEGEDEGGAGRGEVLEMRVVPRPSEEPGAAAGAGRPGRHAADPDDDASDDASDDARDDASDDARTDTLGGPEAPTVALPARRRRR